MHPLSCSICTIFISIAPNFHIPVCFGYLYGLGRRQSKQSILPKNYVITLGVAVDRARLSVIWCVAAIVFILSIDFLIESSKLLTCRQTRCKWFDIRLQSYSERHRYAIWLWKKKKGSCPYLWWSFETEWKKRVEDDSICRQKLMSLNEVLKNLEQTLKLWNVPFVFQSFKLCQKSNAVWVHLFWKQPSSEEWHKTRFFLARFRFDLISGHSVDRVIGERVRTIY